MLVIPAIDLKDGKVVRLLQGRYEEVTVYSHDPVETAKTWKKQGARRLHIIDLDGALTGEVKNLETVREIIETTELPVEFGGGLREIEDVTAILTAGAKWAILGTKACEDLEFVKKAVMEFGEQIIVSIDVKYGKVATRAWTDISEMDAVEMIRRLQDIGVTDFIYTDISRDGTLSGSDTQGVSDVLDKTGASIIYSGGISSTQDIKALRELENKGLLGIIIGKALYEDKISLMQIEKLLEGNS